MQSAPELLGSPAMLQLLMSLRSAYNVILLDSSPLGAGVDPLVLGTASGSLLVVLRSGVTDRELAEAKLDALDRMPIRVLGAILNDIRPGGYNRYYHYQYYTPGYETRDESTEPAEGQAALPKAAG
jgi:Mrp family chromosome partitioning ATPase